MRNLKPDWSFACAKFHVLTRSTKLITRENDQQCTFENVDRQKSLPTVVRAELLQHELPVRKDPAVHVSLSSDSLVKQPGNLAIPTCRAGKASKRAIETHASEYNRMHFH